MAHDTQPNLGVLCSYLSNRYPPNFMLLVQVDKPIHFLGKSFFAQPIVSENTSNNTWEDMEITRTHYPGISIF